MPAKRTDRELNSLIFQAIVPEGLRPSSPSDIEAMLDTIGGEEQSDEKFNRMLRKIRGEEPIGVRHDEIEPTSALLTAEEEKLVALYRSRGERIPPEIEAKLEEMRKRARQKKNNEGQDE